MFFIIGIISAFSLIVIVPMLCWKFGPKLGSGGSQTMLFLWCIFGAFPCAGLGAEFARWLSHSFN